MSQTTITERTELAQELAPLVKSLLAKESKNVADVELVESTDGVSTLPAIYSAGGIKKVVRIATSTLVQETSTKADALVVAATEAANAATSRANTAADNADKATELTKAATEAAQAATEAAVTATDNAQAATATCESYNEHPTKIGENWNWWAWDAEKQEYYDTGVVAKGGAIYPSFTHEGNKLCLVDCPEQLSDKFGKQGNKLTFSFVY